MKQEEKLQDTNKKKAFFLDRDGVINVEKSYVYKIEDFEFIDGVKEALKYIQDRGYLLFIITNQSGIGRGYYSIDDFKKLTSYLLDELKKDGISIQEVQFCPHSPQENCKCRKPNTLMVDRLVKKYNIDKKNSFLVGDKNSDIECGINSGIGHLIQVKSGHKFSSSKANYIIKKLDILNIKKII